MIAAIFEPLQQSYGNLAIQMPVFYPVAQVWNHSVGCFHMIVTDRWTILLRSSNDWCSYASKPLMARQFE